MGVTAHPPVSRPIHGRSLPSNAFTPTLPSPIEGGGFEDIHPESKEISHA